MVRINSQLEIPEAELTFATARSSGPGGQNVNKVESRVTLLFDVAGSPSLSDSQRRRITARLATRINREGVLRVSSQQHRTQAANRAATVERFAELLAAALRRPRARKPTRVPAGVVRRRLETKRRRGKLKTERRGAADEG